MHDVVARPSSICDESNDCRDYATYCDFAIHFCPCLISAHPPESLRRFSNAATFGSLLNSAHVLNPERRRRMIVSRLIFGKRAITSSSENFSPSMVYIIQTNLDLRAASFRQHHPPIAILCRCSHSPTEPQFRRRRKQVRPPLRESCYDHLAPYFH